MTGLYVKGILARVIELLGVEKTYAARGAGRRGAGRGDVAALRPLDLTIAEGEVFGVIGRSGAGKSTLIRLINLLERPTAGRVIVDGRDATALTPSGLRALRRDVGMIFQHFALLSSRTVAQNVALPLKLARRPKAQIAAKVEELLARVGLSAQADAYPAQLSGGQKQRVGIARALATGPKILLCDEATSALDPETTADILDLLAQLNRELGLTIVLITHEMDVVRRVCDRVAVLDGGALVELGAAAEVFLHPKTPAARRLLREVEGDDAADVGGPRRRLRLTFRGDTAYAPALSQAARDSGVDFSILSGRIARLKDAPYGRLTVAMQGGDEEGALTRLRAAGVEIEEA